MMNKLCLWNKEKVNDQTLQGHSNGERQPSWAVNFANFLNVGSLFVRQSVTFISLTVIFNKKLFKIYGYVGMLRQTKLRHLTRTTESSPGKKFRYFFYP